MKSRASIYRAQNIHHYAARRDLRSGEACLRNGVEIFAAKYPKVEKG